MGVTNAYCRGFLRKAFADSCSEGCTLLSKLLSYSSSLIEDSSGGKFISQASANGASTSFLCSEINVGDLSEMIDHLLCLYDEAIELLDESQTDTQIYNKMLSLLVSVRVSSFNALFGGKG